MRTFSGTTLALLESGSYARRDLILFDMPTGRYGFWSNDYDLSYGGDIYKGVPGVFSVSDIQSTMDLVVDRLDVVFSALDPEVNLHVENEAYHRRPVYVHVAIINPHTRVVVEVLPWFIGVIDQASTSEKLKGPTTLTVRLESGNWELNRIGTRTRSDADQKQIDSADGSMRYVETVSSTPIWWGRAGPKYPGAL